MTVNNVIERYIFIRNMNQHFRNKARYHVEREERHGFKKLIMKTAVSRLELTMGGGGVPRGLFLLNHSIMTLVITQERSNMLTGCQVDIANLSNSLFAQYYWRDPGGRSPRS